MAENVRLEEIIEISRNSVDTHGATMNNRRQIPGLPMTHSTNISQSGQTVNIRTFNISARTVEHSRVLANNFASTFEEIRPLIENVQIGPGILLSSLLNPQRIQAQVRNNPSSTDSYIINLEDQTNGTTNVQHQHVHDHHHHQTMATDNFLNNIREAANEVAAEALNNNINNNNTDEVSQGTFAVRPERRELLKILQRCVPFVFILLIKGLYDHIGVILTFIALLFTTEYANNNLKQEIAKQHNRNWITLMSIIFSVVGCIAFINSIFEIHIFMRNTPPLTFWELSWSLVVTDFILKLITIVIKAIVTCLPVKLLALRKRGKYYLLIEAMSQLYRSIAPVQPWFYYLEAYEGTERIVGIFLSVMYTVSKENDVLSRLKLFHTAVCELRHNSLESSPTKEQLAASGGICAICRDEFNIPVRLPCKHIFCEVCVLTWFNRERSCPLCRAPIADDQLYQDGHTALFIQTY